MINDQLFSYVGVSKFSPLRSIKLKHFILNNELTNDAKLQESVKLAKEELKCFDLNALHLYSLLQNSKDVTYEMLVNAITERFDLISMYSQLNSTVTCDFEVLITDAEKSLNTEDFWFYHQRLMTYLHFTAVDVSNDMKNGKRCLQIESLAAQKRLDLLKHEKVAQLEVFEKLYSECTSMLPDVQILMNHFTKRDPLYQLHDSLKSIDFDMREIILKKAYSFADSITLSDAYNLWKHDNSILSVFSLSTIQLLENEILEYFYLVDSNALVFDLLDLVTRTAVNDAVHGKSLPEIEQRLGDFMEIISKYKLNSYQSEFEKICTLVMKKCKEICDAKKEDV